MGLVDSFRDAFRGVLHTLRTERNLRLDFLAALLVAAAGVWLAVTPVEWAILALAVSLVWLAEMLNTALENLADAAVPRYHPLVGVAKDVAAGAVLVSATGAAVVGLLILGPRLIRLAGW